MLLFSRNTKQDSVNPEKTPQCFYLYFLQTHVTDNPQVKFESSRANAERPQRTSTRRVAHNKTEGELRCRGPFGRRSEAIGGGPSETGCGNEMCASVGFRSTCQIKFMQENLKTFSSALLPFSNILILSVHEVYRYTLIIHRQSSYCLLIFIRVTKYDTQVVIILLFRKLIKIMFSIHVADR